jgi:flagellar basal body P-ring formation protein FlgA
MVKQYTIGALVLGFINALTVTNATAEDRVTIKLKPTSPVTSKIVLIGHIAEISGGSSKIRERIKHLDISAAPTDRPESVTQEHVQIRLLLADVPKHGYQLTGSKKTSIFAAKKGLDEGMLLRALHESYGQEFGVDHADLDVRLTQPVKQLDQMNQDEQYEFRPFLPQNPRLGRTRLNVGVYKQDRLVTAIPVFVDVRQFQLVATAASLIRKGQHFTKTNIRFERRAFTTLQRSIADESLLGLASRRNIYPGQSVSIRDADAALKPTQKVLVKQRDIVQIIARKGTLRIVVRTGEALQNGNLGQQIRVRNLRSNKTILGKVISNTQVEISL